MKSQNHQTKYPDSNHEKIAARAYQIWETSGRPGGLELKHWLQAEEEISDGQSLKGRPASTGGPRATSH